MTKETAERVAEWLREKGWEDAETFSRPGGGEHYVAHYDGIVSKGLPGVSAANGALTMWNGAADIERTHNGTFEDITRLLEAMLPLFRQLEEL